MDYDYVLLRALGYLREVQAADGSFSGQTSRTQHPFEAEDTYATVFTPAQILNALADIPQAMAIRQPLAAWLMAQRSKTWTYNYWARSAPQRLTLPYPDDLDDTFCSITALYRHDQALVPVGSLGEIVHILIAAESQVGGPYHTWLVAKDTAAIWQDVDVVVNANIAYFLRKVAEPLPSLTALMDQAIATNTFVSPYYPGPLPVLYCITRAYTGERIRQLTAAILRHPPHTAIEQALWCTALLQLGEYHAVRPVLTALCNTQAADGSWPAGAFCIDPAKNGTTYYQGAATLTTACVAEALYAYSHKPAANTATTPVATHSSEYAASITAAKATFARTPPELRAQCYTLIDTMANGDISQEIVMLPYLFAASLTPQPTMPAATLTQLSLANIYGWMAYTVYDDFLDDEGTPVLLPAANAALRASVTAFDRALPGNTDFQSLVQQTFNTIDNANTWELQQCRASTDGAHITLGTLPRFGQLHILAERSLGHALTPIGVLLAAGYGSNSRVVSELQISLRHYLIARQLQDDLHDWERDLHAGQLNAVVVAILRQLHIQPGTHDLSQLLPRMQRVFWQHVLPQMCNRCLHHIQTARVSAKRSGVLAASSPFYTLYDRLDDATRQTLASQADALAFLAGYKKPPV